MQGVYKVAVSGVGWGISNDFYQEIIFNALKTIGQETENSGLDTEQKTLLIEKAKGMQRPWDQKLV